MTQRNAFDARTTMDTPLGERVVYRLDALESLPGQRLDRMPYSIKVLLEACLRNVDGRVVTADHVKALAAYDPKNTGDREIPFKPGRVVLQDFTGVPAVVDLAAMRAAMDRLGGDPQKVNPLVPCDLVIDHSVQVDAFASDVALRINSEKEFERNNERYEFLKWGQKAFRNFRVVPPATGIVHQVNLEYLAKVVWDGQGVDGQEDALYPDSLVGTDSHTTMINGLGVLGWGVGGIEAEAVMLGQPIYMLIPEVVGFKLNGRLPEGATATDLVLTVTQMLRKHGVVGKFVEFFGPGLASMPLANRATIANMAPEYGATMGFFPVDEQTTKYMRLTGRDEKLVQTVEQYCKAQGLWRTDDREADYSDTLELDMSTVVPSLAGPKRPQDRIALTDMQRQWRQDLSATFNKPTPASPAESTPGRMASEGGAATTSGAAAVAEAADNPGAAVEFEGQTFTLNHGDVVIAAITSCTNTSNPEVMIAAGLVARNAREKGLNRKPWVKTSLAPGSKVVTEYYEKSGLNEDLDALGFHLVGYGCTTCIGNSGPLPEPISKAVNEHDLVVASVLSGNRNFEGRVNPDVKANYLASPPLVVAYAIAGTVDIDLQNDPLGEDAQGNPVYLEDIWPSQAEIQLTINAAVSNQQFEEQYADVFAGSDEWRAIETTGGALYDWKPESTYVQEPPFFVDMSAEPEAISAIRGARCLVKVGDSVTTDHISPAGSIKKDSPAGKYLVDNGVPVSMFNSYGSRRGNDRVMVRGTFANIRVRNQLAPGTEGGWTTYLGQGQLPADATRPAKKSDDAGAAGASGGSGGAPAGEVVSIFDAARAYGACQTSEPDVARTPEHTPLVVLAGKDYGMGSSRDWAAKGTYLLGVHAVIAESYERIHRSNLVGMGVLPLQYQQGETAESLGLDGNETFDIDIDDTLKPRQQVTVTATKTGPDGKPTGEKTSFVAICRIDTDVEVDYYRNGGILHTVLRGMARG